MPFFGLNIMFFGIFTLLNCQKRDYRMAVGGLQVGLFDFRIFGTEELWSCRLFGIGELWSCQIFGTEAGFVKIYIPGGRKKQLGVLNI